MDENSIKAAALSRIRRETRGRALPVVTSEFSLNGTGIRADLAVLDDCFFGIEIKSHADTLKRLPSQLEGYARYFDRTVLVVAPKHLHGLKGIALHGAEVWRQEVLTDWHMCQPGETRHISGQWLYHLLTAEEERRAERSIATILAAGPTIDLNDARRAQFEAAFRKRYGVSSARFWEAVRGRKITANDLKLLSRFHADRLVSRDIEQRRSERWADWVMCAKEMVPIR